MNPLDIARIVGIALAIYFFSKYLKTHPNVFEPLKPKVWIGQAKAMSKRNWARVIGVGVLFACLSLVLIPQATTKTEEAVGPVIADTETHAHVTLWRFSPYVFLIILVVFPPIEEWFFRGIMLKETLKYGRIVAVGGSAIAFGALHVASPGAGLAMFIPTFAGGLLFGCAYLWGGLVGSSIAHSGYNFLAWTTIMLA